MLIKIFIIYLKLIILLLVPISIHAKEVTYISNDFNVSVVENIDLLFVQNPRQKDVTWLPKIKGKSKYSFRIPRDGHEIAKKYSDSSDLFYMSEQIDSGLKFQSNNSQNIDIVISKHNSYLTFQRSILSNMVVGLFLKNKEKTSFGLNLNKDFILNNTLFNVGIEQAKNEHTVFNTKFVKLFNNENSEFHGNINHDYKSNILNTRIGYTWFEIANQFDFTLGIQEQNKKVESEIYTTFGAGNFQFEIGLNQIKDNSNMNMFFNFKFENMLNKKNFGTNVMLTSKDNIRGLDTLSLKSFRKKNLDKLWEKHINYH